MKSLLFGVKDNRRLKIALGNLEKEMLKEILSRNLPDLLLIFLRMA